MDSRKAEWLGEIGLEIRTPEYRPQILHGTESPRIAEERPKKKRRWVSLGMATWLFYTVGLLVIPFGVGLGLLLVWAYILNGVDNPFVGIACGMVGIGVYLGCEWFLSVRDYIY